MQFRSVPLAHSKSSAIYVPFSQSKRLRLRHVRNGWCSATRGDNSVDLAAPPASRDEAVQRLREAGSHDVIEHVAHTHKNLHHTDSGRADASEQQHRHLQHTSPTQTDPRSARQPQQELQEQQEHQPFEAGYPAAGAVASTASIDLQQLFPSRHVPRWTPMLVAYFPFGCIIGVLRMVLWVLLLAVDSPLLTNNNAMIQVFYAILGIRVKWHGEENLPEERHVMVSNHVTVGDLMVLYARPRSYVHLITSRLPQGITQASNHRVKLRHASGDTYRRLADSPGDPDPVHLFPEGGMTSGSGMMRFSRGFMRFGRELPIVPAAMRARLAFDISTHTLHSSFGANMFWFCFAPWVSLDVTVLPPMRPAEGEGNGFFVDRVQRAIAGELGVPIADINLQQKAKLRGH